MPNTSHHDIRNALLARIHAGEWDLGALIPGEAQLADEYGCARTTVNRALQTLAGEGLLVRKRRGGTRITTLPAKQARLDIAVLREQIEAQGAVYGHELFARKLKIPPASIAKALRLGKGVTALYLETLHRRDQQPYAFDVRWVNQHAVPQVVDASLTDMSINEWLVRRVPFSSGDVAFSAVAATRLRAACTTTLPRPVSMRCSGSPVMQA